MKNKYRFLFVLTILPASISLSAQSLTINECLELALRENKDVLSAQWKAEQYEQTRKALHANYFPRLSVQVVDFWSSLNGDVTMDISNPVSDIITKRITELFPRVASSRVGEWYLTTLNDRLSVINPVISVNVGNVISAMGQIEQPIYMGGKISAGYKMGQLGESMARLGIEIAEDEVVLNTYEAYSLVVKAKEMQVVALKYDSLLVQISETVSSAVKNGMARQADLMKVQSAISKSKLQLNQAENGLRLATMNLCHVIGLPLLSKIEVSSDPLELNVENSINHFNVFNRKEYAVLDKQAQIAEQKVKLERSNYLPQVGLMISGGYLDGMQMVGQKLFENNLQGTLALSVKVPLYHASEGRHKVKAAKAEYQQARLEQANLNEMMELEIQQALNEMNEAQLEVNLNQNLVDEAYECLRTSRKAHGYGMETLTDVLTAQTEWQKAYADLVESKHTYVIKQINLLKVTGSLRVERYTATRIVNN